MPQEPNLNAKPPAPPRASIEEDRDLGYWAAALNVTREELRSALEELGPIAGDGLERRRARG